jgi:hypothetical protein
LLETRIINHWGQRASSFRRAQMDRFSEGTQKLKQAFTWEPFADGMPERVVKYPQHAAASQRFRVSDGPELWSLGQVSFNPPASQPVAPGTSPQSGGLFQWRA